MPTPADRIRILQIIKGLDIGGVNGGAERFGLDLAFALDPALFEVSVCIFFQMQTPMAKEWENRIDRQGIDHFFAAPWAGNDRFSVYLQGIRQLKNQARTHPYHIAHSHFQLGTLAALYIKASRLARRSIRTVHIAHEWDPNWYGWMREQTFSKWIFPLMLDAEVGVSQALVDKLKEHPGVRISHHQPRLIYNAIPMRSFEKPVKPDSNQPPVIGVVGRLAEQKGHRFLIQAIPLVKNTFPDIRVWIVGDGEKRFELEEMVTRLNLQNNVEFLGLRNDIPTLLAQMTLFVLPSLWEGLPTVVMESFSQGVPVLATDIPGTRELIHDGENGWLVPPGDTAALAQRIITLLQNPQMLASASQTAMNSLERFSIQNVSKEYAGLYRELLERH